jgi:C4-dicarboxylate-specific signal transduction histidine kinase
VVNRLPKLGQQRLGKADTVPNGRLRQRERFSLSKTSDDVGALADRDRLMQVLINLIDNAIKMPLSTRIVRSISSSNKPQIGQLFTSKIEGL